MSSKPYQVYIADVSYFSGKFEAYLRYKQIPYNRIEATPTNLLNEVYPATGLMKVPVAQTPDGDWLKDTTPMIQWFERQHPNPSVMPDDPATRFIALLCEDYADEWLWRPALYYRWRFKDDRKLLSRRISREILAKFPGPQGFKAWYFALRQDRLHIKHDGVRPKNEAHVQATYLNLLDGLETLFADRPFVLGSHPSIADFGLFGPLFRHFNIDPTPAKIMRDRAPAVYEWVARLWNARADRLPETPEWATADHAGWQHLLTEFREVYLPYLAANSAALAAGESHFDFHTQGVIYPQLPVNRYRVWCHNQLQKTYAGLGVDAQTQVGNLIGTNVGTWLQQAPVDSGLEGCFDLPLPRKNYSARGLKRLNLYLNGTPTDHPQPTR